MKNVTLVLRADDVEPFLRLAAEDAAKFCAWCDYIHRKVGDHPGRYDTHDEQKKEWQKQFLRAKRIVESFGVEYEQTSKEETLTVAYPYVGGKKKIVKAGDIAFQMTTGSKPDYKKPYPHYWRGVHAEACRQAADRVVRKWRATL